PCASSVVHLTKASNSKPPIDQFHKTVLDDANTSANTSTDFGPMSRDIQPSGMPSSSTTLLSASAANSEAAMRSTGSTSLSPNRSNKDLQLSIWSSCSKIGRASCRERV